MLSNIFFEIVDFIASLYPFGFVVLLQERIACILCNPSRGVSHYCFISYSLYSISTQYSSLNNHFYALKLFNSLSIAIFHKVFSIKLVSLLTYRDVEKV